MTQKSVIKIAFENYISGLDDTFHLKNIFFDMDGVLYDSMPMHSKAWLQVFSEYGLEIDNAEPYLNEGATAIYTVKEMFSKYLKQEASKEIAEKIKNRKHELMSSFPESGVMSEMPELLKSISKNNIDCWVVTGSAQSSLLDRLEKEYEGCVKREKMITAHDVKNGKPHPEPYLKALKKSGYKISESIVVENAPLGVKSAKAAGLFTIAINTGPLNQEVLSDAGADIVLSGSKELSELWPLLNEVLSNKK